MAQNILPKDAAVLYLRMSSAKQDKSIPAQRDELTRLAKLKGYQVVREYVDPAVSGDDTERRVGFLKLREDCENGPDFSVILVWHEDRFSRNDPLEYGYWLKPIRDSGVVLETPTGRVDWESLGGRLLSLIGQEMRHDYLRQLSRNVTRGLLASAKAGRGGTGGTSPQGLRADPERAVVVLRMFEEYEKAESSLRSVANSLNRDGIRSAKGNLWTTTTVRYVLRNRKYCGDYVRFRFRAGKYHGVADGEIVSRRKTDKFAEVAPVVVENHHKAIVPRKLFDRVQAKLARQQKRTAHRTGRQYIFSGLLRCGDCDHSLSGRPNHRAPDEAVYRCHHYTTGGRAACNSNTVREPEILAAVVGKLQTQVFSETAINRLLAAYRKRLATRRRVVPADDGGRLRKQIEKLDQQIDQGLDRLLVVPEKLVATLSAKLDKLKAERDRLKAQLQAPGRAVVDATATDDAKVKEAARVLRDMREAFLDAKPEEIRDLIGTVVVEVKVRFSHKAEKGRTVNTPTGGEIVVCPPAQSSLLFTSLNS